MHPVLFSFHLAGRQSEVVSYAVLVVLGCVAGIVYAVRAAPRVGVEPLVMRDLCLAVVLTSVVGAHGLYVLTQARQYWDRCLDALADGDARAAVSACGAPLWFWQGGLVFFGGVATGILTTWLWARRHRLPFWRLADLLAPALALGHAIGRVGCLMAGCCWGKTATGVAAAWGIRLPPTSAAYQELLAQHVLSPSDGATMPLHPTQIYESVGELALFVVLLRVARARRRDGLVTLAYLIGYSSLRIVVEIFRGDATRRFFVEMETPRLNEALGLNVGEPSLFSLSQGLGLLAIIACGVIAIRRR